MMRYDLHRLATRARKSFLRLERLESRQTPATFTVSNLNDSGTGSLRQAILDANANAGLDTVVFTTTPGAITLTSGEIAITDSVIINGPGSANLTVSGNNASRIFKVDNGAAGAINATINNLTLSKGLSTQGGAIQIADENVTINGVNITGSSAGTGGAIDVGTGGTLSLVTSTLSSNKATAGAGGAINFQNTGTLTVDSSTIANNTASAAGGGIEAAAAALTVVNSTLSANTAGTLGGAIDIGAGAAAAKIQNSTIANNAATTAGGGISSARASSITNTLIAANTAPVNADLNSVSGAVFDVGFSIVQVPGTASIISTLGGNLLSTVPLLGPLQINGGTTPTILLLAGSPGLNAGQPGFVGLTVDQLGQPRVAGGQIDIGAVEAQTGFVTGQIFADLNGNGVLDVGETGVPAATVFSDVNNNGFLDIGEATALTAANGTFTLMAQPGTINVRTVVPVGFHQTTPDIAPFVITAGQTVANNNFGLQGVSTGTVEGMIFNDVNGNGILDAGESGLVGVTVFADTNNNGVLDAGEVSAVTGVGGTFTLTLPPGTFSIRQVLPAGFQQITVNPVPVTVVAGGLTTNINFGNKLTGSTGTIQGTIFNDVNGNGVIDAGELGMAGVTVFADTNLNGMLDAGEISAITLPGGTFTLTLPPGTFSIRQLLPSGFQQITTNPAPISVVSGGTTSNINFGNKLSGATGTVQGTVFTDTNLNGVLDAGEVGVAGVTVFADTNLNGKLDAGEIATTTAGNGTFTLTLQPGTATIRQVIPAGLQQTTINPAAVTVTAGGNTANINFGVTPAGVTGNVTGTVFIDVNGNGIQDAGEAGLTGVTVFADTNANGMLDAGEFSTVTGAGGMFSLALPPGNFSIRQVIPAGFQQITLNPVPVTVVSGGTVSNINFGNKLTGSTGTISGTVFTDTNLNGVLDAGEVGIPGVIVFADTNFNGVLDAGEVSAVTLANGSFTLTLPPGNFSIRQVLPAGMQQVSINPPLQAVTAGGAITNINFGNKLSGTTGTIQGTVFTDVNNNGILDVGEVGIGGVTVFSDVNLNSKLDAGEVSTVTAANGTFTLVLTPGTANIRQVVPTGFVQTSTNPAALTVTAGGNIPNINFGNRLPGTTGSVEGTVFIDVNGNGVLDAGEVGIPGVTVFGDLNGNGILDAGEISTTTGVNGTFTLNLAPGTVTIRQIVPQGFVQVGTSTPITVVAGQTISNINIANKSVTVQPTTRLNAVGSGETHDGESVVRVFRTDGSFVTQFAPYPGFTGGITVATGDVTGDGVEDLITGAGWGGGPHVRVFDGAALLSSGTAVQVPGPIGSFFAYAAEFRGGVYVAAGDVNGDGRADVITGAGMGGGPHVIAYDAVTGARLASFFAYDPNFSGGVSVAAGDITGDGRAEIITGAGAGGGPHVKAFNVATGAPIVVREFFAYDAAFRGGVYVAAGDLNNDGLAEIITGAGASGGPHVEVFNGANQALISSFFAYDSRFTGGARVAVGDYDNDGVLEIVTGAGPGGGPHVRSMELVNLTQTASFFAFDDDFNGGVYVG